MATFPNAQNDPNGAIPVYVVAAPLAPADSYVTIAANGGVQAKTGPGVLLRVNVNHGGGGSGSHLGLYDGTSNAGALIARIDTTVVQAAFTYNVPFTVGLFIEQTSVSADGNSTVTFA